MLKRSPRGDINFLRADKSAPDCAISLLVRSKEETEDQRCLSDPTLAIEEKLTSRISSDQVDHFIRAIEFDRSYQRTSKLNVQLDHFGYSFDR